jgi:hypothetical protein
MKPRTASLQVGHQKSCPHYGINSLDSAGEITRHARGCPQHVASRNKTADCTCGATPTNCTCKPAFFTLYRDDRGAWVRGDNGEGRIVGRTHNRREAERWLVKLQERIENGLTRPDRVKTISLNGWIDLYLNEITARRVRAAS